jgi:riboflavin synthase
MFTGLVEAIGTVRAIVPHEAVKRFVIEAPFAAEVKLGDSVCIDGACQTVVAHEQHTFAVEAIPETLKRTKFGDYKVGQKVNIERALCFSDRLSGHVVQGHIDCTGRISKMHLNGEERIVTVEFPSDYAPLLVEKGSVALDGVSLTVVDANARTFTVALIPHTWEGTTLGDAHTGDRLNLEFDLFGKYILRFKQAGVAGVTREIARK